MKAVWDGGSPANTDAYAMWRDSQPDKEDDAAEGDTEVMKREKGKRREVKAQKMQQFRLEVIKTFSD